jgi:hypothetical protein
MIKIQFNIRNQDHGSLRCVTVLFSGTNTCRNLPHPCLNTFEDGGSRFVWNICTHESKVHSATSQMRDLGSVLNGSGQWVITQVLRF